MALHKSAIVASSTKLKSLLTASFGKFAGKRSNSTGATNLGVDFYAESLRCKSGATLTLQGRLESLKKRKRKLYALKKAGVHMDSMFVSGLQSFGFHGSEVVGVTTKELITAQHEYLSIAGSPAKSCSKPLSLMLIDDPMWRQAIGPALSWATIVWKAATGDRSEQSVSLSDLARLASPVLSNPPKSWAAVRGPLGAAHLSLDRIGWEFDGPFKFATAQGLLYNLTDSSPCMIQGLMQKQW